VRAGIVLSNGKDTVGIHEKEEEPEKLLGGSGGGVIIGEKGTMGKTKGTDENTSPGNTFTGKQKQLIKPRQDEKHGHNQSTGVEKLW